MTTIAYHHKDKQIAVDGRLTSGSHIDCDSANKTIKNDLGLWFIAGSICDYDEMSKLKHGDKCGNVDNLPNNSALLCKGGDCYLVIVDGDGYCNYTRLTFNDAIGTGAIYATSSMDHGKSAKESVQYAASRDIYTGGKIRVFDVK